MLMAEPIADLSSASRGRCLLQFSFDQGSADAFSPSADHWSFARLRGLSDPVCPLVSGRKIPFPKALDGRPRSKLRVSSQRRALRNCIVRGRLRRKSTDARSGPPNGKKVTILLEELGMPYNIVPCNIGKGDQFKDEFLTRLMQRFEDFAVAGVVFWAISLDFPWAWTRRVGSGLEPEFGAGRVCGLKGRL